MDSIDLQPRIYYPFGYPVLGCVAYPLFFSSMPWTAREVSAAPAAPTDMFAGLGKNGQIVSISKSAGLVIVRMGNQVSSAEVTAQLCNSIWEKLNAAMCNTTPINEANSYTKTISIFPNPGNTEINIVFPASDNVQIEILNTMGQLIIKDQNKNKIDISNLTNGLYFISVKQGQQSYTQKLIKQ